MAVDFGRLLTVFLGESSDQLDRLNALVLDLERSPGATGLLDEIFRHIHSLKGGAASFGFGEVASLAHDLESYLHLMRHGTVTVSPGTVDVLLSALDAVRVLLDGHARGGGDELDPAVLREAAACGERLHMLAGGLPPAAAVGRAPNAFPPPEARDEAEELMAQGRRVYDVRIRFAADVRMASVRTYLIFSNVERVGTVVAARPGRDEIDDEGFDGVLRLLTVLDDDAELSHLEEACQVDQVEEVAVEPLSVAEPSAAAAAGVGLQQPQWAPSGGESTSGRGEAGGASSKGRGEAPAPLPPSLPAGGGGERFVRVDIEKVDGLLHLASELWILRTKLRSELAGLREALGSRAARSVEELLDRQEQHLSHLRDDIMSIRMVPVRELFQRFPRLVRDLARATGKDVDFVMEGEGTELDKKLVERLADPLVHLLRNAVDHGIETPAVRRAAGKPERGTLRLVASHTGHTITLELTDDGGGVDCDAVRRKSGRELTDQEACDWLFRPGFSTRDEATELSGRGVGLDVVRAELQRLNGSVVMSAVRGQGTRVTLQLPLTLAMTNALLVQVAGEIYALPVTHVHGTLMLESLEVFAAAGRGSFVRLEGRPVPYFDLGRILGAPGAGAEVPSGPRLLVHVGFRDREALVGVDGFVGQEEMVIKSLAEHYRDQEGVAGASFLSDGRVVLILDIPSVVGRHLHLGGEGRVLAS